MTDRVRIVVPRFGAAVSGGSETAMRRLAHALSQRGWSVSVWTTTAIDEATWREDLPPGPSRDGGIAVRRFPVLGGRAPRLFAQASRVFWTLPARLRWETAWVAAQGPWSPALVHALARSGGPTLFTPYLYYPTLRGAVVAPHPRIIIPAAHDEAPLRLRAVRAALTAADGLWFHSPEERQLTTSVHPGVASTPSAVGTVAVDLPPGIDGRRFARRRALEAPYLLFGGRAAAGKGMADLLAGFATLRSRRDVRLVITGEAGAGVRGDDVIVTGILSDERRWDAIAGAAMVVIPGALESLSLLSLEAWAAARPTLANRRSAVLAGQSERSGGGLLYAGAEEFATQASRLLDDPAWAAQMGAAGQRFVDETYGWDRVEERLRRLIAVRR